MHFCISVTVDVDPDDTTITGDRQKLEWNSLSRLPELREVVRESGGVITWFVRSDDQIARIHGRCDYLFEKYFDFWEEGRAGGEELALHPHLYVFDEKQSKYAPLRDPGLCCEQVERVHSQLAGRGIEFSSIRIGEAFHSSSLMKRIDELGFSVDATAIPGRRRSDAARYFDWSTTPNNPYRPSIEDYRVPGPNSLDLLEVPMTTTLFQADYDDQPKLRYINLGYRSDIFKKGFVGYLASVDRRPVQSLVFILHPGEIWRPNRCAKDGSLYGFDVATVRRNLSAAVDAISASGCSYSFTRIGDLATTTCGEIAWGL
jgi:hypothetical protein